MNEIVNIQLLNMEIGVKEQLVELPDGNYTLFLNSRYSTDTNYESYLHAYNKHVLGNDFEKSNDQRIRFSEGRRAADRSAGACAKSTFATGRNSRSKACDYDRKSVS